MLTQYAATLLDELKSAPTTLLAMSRLVEAAMLGALVFVDRRRGIACDVSVVVKAVRRVWRLCYKIEVS